MMRWYRRWRLRRLRALVVRQRAINAARGNDRNRDCYLLLGDIAWHECLLAESYELPRATARKVKP